MTTLDLRNRTEMTEEPLTVNGQPPHFVDSPLRRWLCIVPAWFGAVAVYNVFIDPGSFSSPVFALIRDIRPLEWWGVAWAIVAMTATIAGVTGRWWAYLTSHALFAGLSVLWVLQLVYIRWWAPEETRIAVSTLAIFGLWGNLVTFSATVLLIPTSVTTRKPRWFRDT